MRMWHRLHVFAQVLNVLCVIADVVPIDSEHQLWQTTNFAVSSTSDIGVDETSSTINRDGITRNFLEWTDKDKVSSPIPHISNDVSTPETEVTVRSEAFVEAPYTRPQKISDNETFVGERSMNHSEDDFDNVIDTFGESNIDTEHRPNHFTTEKIELPMCNSVETSVNPRNHHHDQKTTTIINNVNGTEASEIIVEKLKIVEASSETLTVSWDRPETVEKINQYDVHWYLKDSLVSGCRIIDDKPYLDVLIKSLNACTNYRVTVLPVLKLLPGAIETVNGTTELDVNKDSVKLSITAVGTEWIELSWTIPCTDCVTDYTLNVCGSEICIEAQTDKTTYNNTGLSPGLTYTFELTIHGSKGPYGSINITRETRVPEIKECDVIESFWLENYLESNVPAGQQKFDTTPNPPHDPVGGGGIEVGGLDVINTTSSSIEIAWNSTVGAFYYILEWYKRDDAEITTCRTNRTSYVIKSLDSCTRYTVKVMPHLDSANGTRRMVSGVTGLDVHKDSLQLKVTDPKFESLKVTWNMPNDDCVSRYVVSFCDADNCTDHTINKTTYFEKTGLSPCVTYDFNLTVYAENDKAYGSFNVSGTTAFAVPGRPGPAITESGNYSLYVSWPKPKNYTCVQKYRVVWSRDGKTSDKLTTNTFLQLEGLDPCAIYEIIITPVGINNGDGLLERIQSNITAPAVRDPPLMVSGPVVTHSEISMAWRIHTNETNNCSPTKLIVDCEWTKQLGSGYIPVNGTSHYDIPEGTIDTSFRTTVKNISAFTSYDCSSYTYNFGGHSLKSRKILAVTLEDVPTAPTLLPESVSNVTNTSIMLQWTKPKYLPGILQKNKIQVIWRYEWLHGAEWCEETIGTENLTVNSSVTSLEYSVRPFSVYRIRIAAATGAGWGPESEPENYITKPGAPGNVTNLDYTLLEDSVDPTILQSIVTWRLPCLINGKQIEYFNVLGIGTRDGFEKHTFNQKLNYTNDNCLNDTCSMIIEELRDEHKYVITVATKISDYNDLGNLSQVIINYPAGIPPNPNENYTSIISIDPYKARRTTTKATVLLPVFSNDHGVIKKYAIIVSKIGYNNATFGRLKDNAWPPTATWSESLAQDFEIPYQAMNLSLDSYQSYIADYGRFKAVKFVLGEDTETCPEISSNERSYCNGPLKPDTVYHVRMRAFTSGGYRDSIVFTVKTNAELQVALVIGTIFGILFFGILLTMVLLVRKCSMQAVLRRFLHSDMPGSPVPAPFTRRKFIAHCQQLADNPGKLSNEYQLLQTLSVDLQMPTNAACLQANKKKNRYIDILPYDFSRVKLEVIDNDPNTDYINASLIKGFTGEEDYIACQGPKEETTYDFWRMIDQYEVTLIVMLTQLVEKNKDKCHQYFPTIRETFTYENMAIRCSMELDYRTYTQRTLVLQKENVKRNIIHLHFKDWPDHDVPEDFDPMINFCQIMRRHVETSRGLVVIHCSAGIGRTGTLIAIDILLQHIKDNRKLDVFGTVYRLRHHRINMVQRESQYAYIYNCIRQVLKNPYFSKTYKPPSADPICDSSSHKKKETSESNEDLVSSLETLKKSSFSSSAESAEPNYHTPSKSSPKSRPCYSFNGLRCAKSAGEIDTRPYQQIIGRYNTHAHPISAIARDALISSSDISVELSDSDESTTSLYENMHPLARSKSAHAIDRSAKPSVTQRLLEHDTSL